MAARAARRAAEATDPVEGAEEATAAAEVEREGMAATVAKTEGGCSAVGKAAGWAGAGPEGALVVETEEGVSCGASVEKEGSWAVRTTPRGEGRRGPPPPTCPGGSPQVWRAPSLDSDADRLEQKIAPPSWTRT